MELQELKDKVTSFGKGTIHTIVYEKELKVNDPKNHVVKRTTTQGRFGVEYDHIKTVYNARNTGDLPLANAGMSGVEWELYPYLVKATKTGKIQLRVTRIESNNKAKGSVFFNNGKEITKEEAVSLCKASEFRPYKAENKPPIFNIGIEKIISIT